MPIFLFVVYPSLVSYISIATYFTSIIGVNLVPEIQLLTSSSFSKHIMYSFVTLALCWVTTYCIAGFIVPIVLPLINNTRNALIITQIIGSITLIKISNNSFTKFSQLAKKQKTSIIFVVSSIALLIIINTYLNLLSPLLFACVFAFGSIFGIVKKTNDINFKDFLTYSLLTLTIFAISYGVLFISFDTLIITLSSLPFITSCNILTIFYSCFAIGQDIAAPLSSLDIEKSTNNSETPNNSIITNVLSVVFGR
jgi:hypothetical protein